MLIGTVVVLVIWVAYHSCSKVYNSRVEAVIGIHTSGIYLPPFYPSTSPIHPPSPSSFPTCSYCKLLFFHFHSEELHSKCPATGQVHYHHHHSDYHSFQAANADRYPTRNPHSNPPPKQQTQPVTIRPSHLQPVR